MTSLYKHRNSGITFIELLLYAAISSVLIGTIGALFFSLAEVRTRSVAGEDIEDQGQAAVAYITHIIRNADAVTTPAAGGSGDVLTLNVPDPSLSPTTISQNGDVLEITEGAQQTSVLIGGRVVVDSFVVENHSDTADTETLRIILTLRYDNPEGREEFQYAQTFYTSATTRNY